MTLGMSAARKKEMLKMSKNNDWVSKPGDSIIDILNERCMPVAEFAKKAGLSFSEANDLIDGKIAITTELARGLEAAFGAPASFWIKRDQNYRNSITCQVNISPYQRSNKLS